MQPLFLCLYRFVADDVDLVSDGGGAFQKGNESAEPILRIAYGIAYEALVAQGTTLDIVCNIETHKAAVGLQLLGVERSLDGDLQPLGRDVILC